MRLKCLGSGSSGNCYLLENDTECLVIEQGISFREVKIALDFDISKIVGAVQSHSHGDHAAYEKDFTKCGIQVFHPGEGKMSFKCGGFRTQAFKCVHDVPCYGFVIWHKDFGSLVFATDTEYVPVNFQKLKPNILMVECNYQDRYLHEGIDLKQNRQYGTHMEEQTAIRFVDANNTEDLRTVILLHMSDTACNPFEAQDAFRKKFKNIAVYIAQKGFEVEL